ncbi:MAG: hypothetical protein WDO14_13250 [Bacteroidota bacterium]
MKQVDLYCHMPWTGNEESLRDRVFLFCIDKKCMTGKVIAVTRLSTNEKFELAVSFIEPKYFENEKKIGSRITIQEASEILAEGIVTRVP